MKSAINSSASVSILLSVVLPSCVLKYTETVVVRNAFEIVLQTVGMTVLGMSEHRPRHAVVNSPYSLFDPSTVMFFAVEMIVLGDDAVLCLGPRGDVVIQQFKTLPKIVSIALPSDTSFSDWDTTLAPNSVSTGDIRRMMIFR